MVRLDFLKSPSSCVFSTRRTKDFSYQPRSQGFSLCEGDGRAPVALTKGKALGTRLFSYLIAANYGSLRFNQSEVPWISLGDRIVKLWATKRDLRLNSIWVDCESPRPRDIMYFFSAQFRHNCLSNVNRRHWISPIRRSIQDSN